MNKNNTYDNYKSISRDSNREISDYMIGKTINNMDIEITKDYSNEYNINNSEDIVNEILNMIDDTDNNENQNQKQKNLSSPRKMSKDVFKTFKPLDTHIINPLIAIFEPLITNLKFKSKTVGTVSIMIFCFLLYFLYCSKNNLVWLFLFLGYFTSLFDDLHYFVCLKKVYALKKTFNNKTNNKTKYIPKKLYKILNYEYNEMHIILVRLTLFVLLFAILKSNMYYNKSNTYLYLLMLMSITIIILQFHTENIILNSKLIKINNRHNIHKNLKIIKKLGISILFIVSIHLFMYHYKKQDLLNILLLNNH